MRAPTVRYRSFVTDSARWDGLPFREGDIVISTPPKCGTTWTQMICALLIFQTPDFPAPLDAMSVWPDSFMHRREDVLATLAAQRHRRFMKTHTPLDGLPRDERVTYLCVGRDPRDAAVSWDNHTGNLDVEAAMRLVVAGGDVADFPPPEEMPPPPAGSERERFWAWVESTDVVAGLPAMMRHLASFWRERHAPDVVMLHFDDLKRDLEGQMRGLAARLGIEVPQERWPDLVRWATFDTMRSNARTLTPEIGIWQDPARFFNRGQSGQWRSLLDAEDLRRYRAKVAALAEPDLIEWVHHGPVLT